MTFYKLFYKFFFRAGKLIAKVALYKLDLSNAWLGVTLARSSFKTTVAA